MSGNIMQTLLLAILVAERPRATAPPSDSGAKQRMAVVAIGRRDDSSLGPAARALRDELRQTQDMAVYLSSHDTSRSPE
jgi:hypothetical protein